MLLSFIALLFFAHPAVVQQTIQVSCTICPNNSYVTVTGTGYGPLSGSQRYELRADIVATDGTRITEYYPFNVDASGNLMDQIFVFDTGDYHLCSATISKGGAEKFLACVNLVVE